jgi:hypothetical protein
MTPASFATSRPNATWVSDDATVRNALSIVLRECRAVYYLGVVADWLRQRKAVPEVAVWYVRNGRPQSLIKWLSSLAR